MRIGAQGIRRAAVSACMSTSSTAGGPGRRGALGAAVAGLVVGAVAAGGAYAYGNGFGAARDTPAASSATRVQVAQDVAALDRPRIDPILGALTTAAVPVATPRTRVVRRARTVVVTHRVRVAAASEATVTAGAAQPVTRATDEADDVEAGDDAGRATGEDAAREDAQGADRQRKHRDAGDAGGDHQGDGGHQGSGEHHGGGQQHDGGDGGGGDD